MGFTGKQIHDVWNKAKIVPGADPSMFRKDACGAWIRRDKYGDQESLYGWEIDHIFPENLGGTSIDCNLRALQHQNNASKGDDYPSYEAVVTAEGTKNIPFKRFLKVNESVRKILKKYYKDA